MKVGKRLKQARESIDASRTYPLAEAIEVAKKTATVKFDASIEVHCRLGIDPKKAEQIVRASVVLPHGTGKKRKIAAFVQPDKADEASAAGADVIGGKEMVAEILKTGKVDFDIAVTTPDFMKELAKVARILGPKGLMPSPKSETITTNLAKTIQELQSGKQEFRSDNTGNLHFVIGKVSMSDDQLQENFTAFFEAVKKAKPDDMKGSYLKGVTMNATMGPSIRVAV